MEDIYLKNMKHHSWHSKIVHLGSYFEQYSDSYCKVMKRSNMKLCKIFHSVLGDDNAITDKNEMVHFFQEMSELKQEFKNTLPSLETFSKRRKQPLAKLKSLVSKKSNLKGVPPKQSLKHHGMVSKKQGDSIPQKNLNQNPEEEATNTTHRKTASEIVKDRNLSSPKSSLKVLKLRDLKKAKKPKYNNSVLTTRGELLLDKEMNKSRRKDLKKGKHFVVSFRIHKPFAHRVKKAKVENFMQEILVLGHQTLDNLRDKIICQADFQDSRGEISNDPDSLVTTLSRDKYKSAMFYFDNTFYIDERGDQDYSEVVRRWALPRGISVGATRHMGSTRVSDLRIRFGYPYLYMHQGSCEHLVIISNARLLMGKDSLDSRDYPLLSRIPRPITIYCFTCFTKPAKWIVYGCENLPKDIAHMCTECFKSYNYMGGRKIGNFKAYRFFQINSLL